MTGVRLFTLQIRCDRCHSSPIHFREMQVPGEIEHLVCAGCELIECDDPFIWEVRKLDLPTNVAKGRRLRRLG